MKELMKIDNINGKWVVVSSNSSYELSEHYTHCSIAMRVKDNLLKNREILISILKQSTLSDAEKFKFLRSSKHKFYYKKLFIKFINAGIITLSDFYQESNSSIAA